MYMRTVKMFVKLEEVQNFRETYESKILRAFAEVRGCRSAALMQSTRMPEECISLTFWNSAADADAFEKSGHYNSLIQILSSHFSDSLEPQVRLTKYLKLEYATSAEPEVRKFNVDAPEQTTSAGEMFLRMVSLKFREGKVEEFKKHYEKDVVPVLRSVEGCRSAFLAAPEDSPNELISVTEWTSERAAETYEHGGQFDKILESQRHFFSGLYDWGITRQKETKRKVATSEDVTVDHHQVLVGRRFR